MPNNFTYNTGIPNPPNNPSTDVPQMQVNTNSISSLISIDHVGFNTNGSGIHKQVTLNSQGAPGLGDGTGVYYADTFAANTWPAFQNSAGAFFLAGDIPLIGANGYTSVPGPLLIQWGFVNGTHGGGFFAGGDTGVVTFATANINFHNACFGVWTQASFVNPPPNGTITVSPRTASITTTGFDWAVVTNSGAYNRFFWLAIGQ